MYGKKVGSFFLKLVVVAVLIGGTTACTDTYGFPAPRIGSFYEVNPEGAETSFAPSNIVCHSGDNSDMLDTVWSEGVPGTGIGESIEICQMYRGNGEEIFTFTELCIVNGYAKNESKWKENGRVKTFRVYYEGEYLGEMTLLDTRQPQYIDLTPFQLRVANGGEATFRFEIAQVYDGTKYENTCVTGIVIDFAGRAGH